MDIQINLTDEGVLKYPMHRHGVYEIMLYTEGKGVMRTQNGQYPFEVGTVIIVPPNIQHGSSSKHGFRNISLGGEFSHLINFSSVQVLQDTDGDATALANMIYNNRYESYGYLNALCTAYIECLLKGIKQDSALSSAVKRVSAEINRHFCEYDLDVGELLRNSGFAEDYIRAHFKKITGLTPNEFVQKLRMERACYLIELYGENISLCSVGEKCGYLDYPYFSKKFKKIMGMSPVEYRKNRENKNLNGEP